jgi:hypothetical protein
LRIAVAAASTAAIYSKDGSNWLRSPSSISVSTNTGVAWSSKLRIFCLAGTGKAYTSSNGIDWTQSATLSFLTNTEYNCLTWSDELSLFVLVGAGAAYNYILTSPDAVTWTIRNIPGLTGTLESITWAPELGIFCAATNGSASCVTSSDGATWTIRSLPANSSWYGLAWSPKLKLFCTVGFSGSNRVATSPDGVNWTLIASQADSYQWVHVAWSNELSLFCAVGTNGVAMTSADGASWKVLPAPSGVFVSCLYVSELRSFIASSFSGTGTRITTSP